VNNGHSSKENGNVNRCRDEIETACGFYTCYNIYRRYFSDALLEADLKIDNTNKYID
jgi:hypothetical protein